jgi:DNA-binding transcriptional regulator YiaG
METTMTIDETLRLARVRRFCETGTARAIRTGAGLSLSEVSDPVGVARQTILRWERGERKATGEPALRYLALLEELAG